jgi:hypothetical protein
MPLYTYVTVYKGATYVAQARHSNFKGFTDWITGVPANALPDLTPALRRKLNPYDGTFEEVPNRRHVWKKKLMVGGSELVAFVIQTKD